MRVICILLLVLSSCKEPTLQIDNINTLFSAINTNIISCGIKIKPYIRLSENGSKSQIHFSHIESLNSKYTEATPSDIKVLEISIKINNEMASVFATCDYKNQFPITQDPVIVWYKLSQLDNSWTVDSVEKMN